MAQSGRKEISTRIINKASPILHSSNLANSAKIINGDLDLDSLTSAKGLILPERLYWFKKSKFIRKRIIKKKIPQIEYYIISSHLVIQELA